MGKLFSQLVINTTGTKPDFNNEEKASIEKDTRELRQIVREMAEYLPREDPEKGTLYNAILRIARNFLETSENIKISIRPFYHINLGGFSWE